MTENGLNKGLLDIRFLDKSYHEALALIEEVAHYLEHKNKDILNNVSLNTETDYVNESLRVSNCLMRIISWFLVQKAVAVSEITKQQAEKEKFRLGAEEIYLKKIDLYKEKLPKQLIDYIERTQYLYRQVVRMDALIYENKSEKDVSNPVHDLMKKIPKDID